MGITIDDLGDPVRAELVHLIDRLHAGEPVDHRSERRWVDLKEESGRRDKSGRVRPGEPRNEAVARQLAGEAACMANTPGGGALLVGVANDGTLVGAVSDAEWLRQRIFELTNRLLTPDVIEFTVQQVRLLAIISPYAVEPIRMNGRIHWRVNDRCVEVDAATWHAKRMSRLNHDWSADASTTPASAARPQALAIARDFLIGSGVAAAIDLAEQGDAQLLRRLNAVTGDGHLTNAGLIAFVGRGHAALDYVHRDVAGGDSTSRVRRSGRSLLEELHEVFLQFDAHNAVRHVQEGLVVAQVHDLPRLAAREAVVNGVAHRDWGTSAPTVVEHIARTLRVTSPGGFFGGVREDNLLTHPSTSRNTALTLLLADLHIAEREGIGVDRMVREMVRVGHQPPTIREISGPFVRASLIGDVLDRAWMEWLAAIEPRTEVADVNSLLILRRVVHRGWVDAATAAPLIQLTPEEGAGAIVKLSHATLSGSRVLAPVDGVPASAVPAWRLGDEARARMAELDSRAQLSPRMASRESIALDYLRARGRMSSTELGSIVGAAPSNVGSVLKDLQAQGLAEPSSPTGRGRGLFYRAVDGH